jgi:hypothetical protein
VLYPVATLAADNNAITVRLLAPNPEVCLGQKLGLEAVLTNSGKSAIQVSTIGVRGGISLSRYKEDTPEFVANYLAELIPDAIKNGPWVWIPAHQSVSVPFTEPMDQSDPVMEHAYDSPGFFSMQIEFAVFTRSPAKPIEFRGDVPSNKFMFHLVDCSKGKADSKAT